MRKKLPKKLLFLVLFLFLVCKVNAQYAATHYIAPSPWQYWSDANEIVLTTESTTPVTVTLKKSNGTLLATRTLTSAAPDVYRFVGSPWLLNNNPVETIQDDMGLIVESTGGKVSVNLRNVASDQASSTGGDTTGATIKGNASLVSFGNEGRGTSFRLGYYRTDFGGITGFNGAKDRPVYSVMAIEDNTQVKVNGTNLVLLNKGQSYLFQPLGTGDLLEANKPVVANTGAYTDAPGGCGDGAVDQMAPISILGTRYIVVRGSGTVGTGTTLPEQSTIIATEDNTQVTVTNYNENGTFVNTITYPLANGGSYQSIHHGDAINRYSSSIIEADKPIAVYSGTAQNCEVDIATVLPVGGCSGSKWTSTSEFKGYKGQVLPYFGFVLVESQTEPVLVNGLNIETTTLKPRFQIGTTGYYLIRFENLEIGNPAKITITSAARMNVGVVQQGGGFSMSGFFSSFNETPDLPEVTKDDKGCAIKILTADTGLEPYQWYLDGVLLPGDTSQSIVPVKTGNYSITGTRDCGVTGKSAAVYVAVCGDREVEKTVADGLLPGEVVFSVVVKNNGPNVDRNVIVTDLLPTGYTYISDTPSVGTSYTLGTGIWDIGDMAVDATATLIITATIKTAGTVTNKAVVTGDNLDNNPDNDTDIATPLAQLALVKTAATGIFNTAGDIITYDLVLTNTGKVPVFNINITDANADAGSISPLNVATLLPGDSVSIIAKHTVTQADLVAKNVINSAKAAGVDGSNNPVVDVSGTAIDNDTPTETETKSVIIADDDTVSGIDGRNGATNVINIFANDDINGNLVVPANVTITVGGLGVPSGLTLNTDGSIDVAAGTPAGTYTFDYTICEVAVPGNCADATVTIIVNTIEASNDTPAIVNGTEGGTIPTILDNDTLNGLPFLPADIILTPVIPLPPGLTLNPDGTITVAPNTIAGSYPVTYSICQAAHPLICDTATLNIVVEVPAVEIIKKGVLNDTNGDGFAQKGETITYTFSVTNTGTMQLTNIVVTDPMVTVTGGPLAILNVGATDNTTFKAGYVVTQADVDAGSVNNQALVTAKPIVGLPISDLSDSDDPALPGKNDPTITKLRQKPDLKLLKEGSYEDVNKDGVVSVGDRINYIFRVVNTGNVTIKNITVSDPMVAVLGGPIYSLEPLAIDATTFTASYTITQTDIDLGAVYNSALVSGIDSNGTNVDSDSEDVSPLNPKDKFYDASCPKCTVTALEQKSGIALVKTAIFNDENNNGNAEAGETITYSFVVTNTGNLKLTNIIIKDPLPGIVMTGGPISLSPGESDNTTFKGIYAIKQSDINAKKVSNQAFATGENLFGVTVSDASDDSDIQGNNPTVLAIEGCVIKIFNAMSPNGDSKNERFYIQGLECYPDNTVEIYNRWGVLVFERENYNNEERAFRGLSEGRTTVKQSDGLPVGTYFYVLKYKDNQSNAHQEAGYLYLSK
jgi:uncharacterized repeat protein (TIGR01451 family)/gliding motility-associated-like protein